MVKVMLMNSILLVTLTKGSFACEFWLLIRASIIFSSLAARANWSCLFCSSQKFIRLAPSLIPAPIIQEVINMEIALKDGSLHAFEGPIYNQAGELVVPEGQVADDGMLLGMNFYVQGIDGDIPQ